jgi:hypothetical protein
MRRSITTAVVAAALSLAIPAGTALAAHTAPAAHTRPTTALPVITVKMTGKKITVGGALVSGGVRVVSTVTGEPAGGPTFIRLNPGVTVAQFFKAAQGDPNNVALIASIVFSPPANKGTSSAQVSLRPGHYVAVDLAPSPPAMPVTTFKITKSPSAATLPAPQARMSSIEFSFRGPGTLHNGDLVRFGNDGFLVHMIVAARGASLAGAQKIAKLLKQGKNGQAFHLATGFTTFVNALTHGAAEQQVVHVRPGFWVLACLFDTQDGREHTTLGMERVIHITK